MSRIENRVSLSVSRNENIGVCSAWSRYRDFRVTVASHVPDHRSPLPAMCQACILLPQSYPGLFYGRRRVSVDNWPVHGRCRESSRVFLPVRRGSRNSCSSRLMWLLHLSLAFSKFAESYLPHEAVVQDLPYALVVVVSNGLSLDRAEEDVVNTQLGLDRSVFGKLRETLGCTPNSSLLTCFPRKPAHTSTIKKRSVDVGCNGSTCSICVNQAQQGRHNRTQDPAHTHLSTCEVCDPKSITV